MMQAATITDTATTDRTERHSAAMTATPVAAPRTRARRPLPRSLSAGLFGVGAALPLVLAAYASRAGFGRARGWVLAHAATAKRWMGGLLVAVGLLILTGADRWLETRVNDLLPDAWLALTTRI